MHTHTHTVNTHQEQWAAIYAVAPGEQLRVRCLAQEHLSRGIEGGERAVHSLPPPTIPAGRDSNLWPLGYESDSLTIRPRLPPNYIQIWTKYVHTHTHTHTHTCHPSKMLYSTTELNWVVHILNEGLLWQKLSCLACSALPIYNVQYVSHFSTEGTSKHD